MEKIRVGIDLGTTNTLACYMKDSKPALVKFPGGKMLPSVLYLKEDNTLLIGEKARKQGIFDPVNRICSSKTHMGDFKKKWELRGRKFTPTDVAAEILKEVKKRIIKKTKADADAEVEAVITVPAYFTSNQIDETKKAGEQAGMKVLGIVTEPRAAAIANIKELSIEQQKIIVVDLGGGTFDISILEANYDQYDTLAVDGDRMLGGDNFDERIYTYFKTLIEDDLGIDLGSQEASGLSYEEYYSTVGRIEEEACRAKEELSEQNEYEVVIPNLFTYKNENYSLEFMFTREKMYGLCADLFEKINGRIRKVFQDNPALRMEEIRSVILAGGSCYIPKIKEDMEAMFHQTADTTMDRSTMVVIGACFIADAWDDPVSHKDIISHSLGVEVLREDGVLILEKLLKRGQKYPDTAKRVFTTAMDHQESVEIIIYEAGSDKEDVEEISYRDPNGQETWNHDLYGGFVLDGIEDAKKGVPQIEVSFEYDRSRLLTVTARDLKTGAKKKVKVTKGMMKQANTHVEPVDFELLIDTSGSMIGYDMKQAKEAAAKLVNDILDLDVHRLGIIGFGQYVDEVSPLSHQRNKLLLGIDRLRADGWTPMDRAITKGISVLETSKNRKVMLIVTDGMPNYPDKTTESAKKAKQKGIDVITIYVGSGNSGNFNYLKTLASSKAFAFSLQNIDGLADLFQTVVAQYLASARKR